MNRTMKLMGEYGLLLLILVGIPLGCAWLGGFDEVLRDVFTIVPQTDDWLGRPERLWNCRCPFSWWAFFLVGGSATALISPFLWRTLKSICLGMGCTSSATYTVRAAPSRPRAGNREGWSTRGREGAARTVLHGIASRPMTVLSD